MSKWDEHNFEHTITEILEEVRYYRAEHHFGRPYLTAYQLAIEVARRSPGAVSSLGFEIGGVGVGERNSLAQYIAGQLSNRIKSGSIQHIEGAFLSDRRLNEITFDNYGGLVRSSLTGTGWDLSMFRLKQDT